MAAEACVLADGDAARSVGGLDLMWLRDVCAGRPTLAEVGSALVGLGLPGGAAAHLVGWALANGVVEQVD